MKRQIYKKNTNNLDINKNIRLELKKRLQRVSDLMRACSINYQNQDFKSYRWQSLKNLKFKIQNQLEPYELELQEQYLNSDTYKALHSTYGKSGFEILSKL
jgi:hypothetical protein